MAKITVNSGPPADFKQLEAPRSTQVTLYYGGELLGNFPATYTPTTLAFSNPMAIIDTIPAISDEATVGAALASAMPTHQDLVCGDKPRDGCGKLTPDVIGVIFDENHLTAELFINRNLLAVTEQNAARYLPLPERDFSSVYRFDGAVSGSTGGTTAFALSNNNIYSFGEGNLATQSTISNQGLRFDTVAAEVERKGWSASAGLIRSLPLQLASDRDIAGVSLSTSTRTRLDARKTEGNELLVYLPRQAFVSIYRDGRLYSSHSYDAGNQRLDTTELPDGAYNVTLKIQEPDGGTREETRFFAKSEQLPPPDAPTYYVQAGLMRANAAVDATIPDITSAPLIRAGTVRRVSENVGLGLGLLGTSDRAAGEASAFMVSDGMEMRATGFSSTRGDVGAQASFLCIRPKWNTTFDARKLWAGETLPTSYDGLLTDLTQVSTSFSYLFTPQLTVTARANYFASENGPSTTSFGPQLNWQLWQEGESMIYLAADAAHSGGHTEGTALIRFSYRFGSYGVSGESGESFGGNAPGPFGTARLWHDHTTPDNSLLAGANIHDDSNTRSVGADADWRNRYARLHGAVQQSFGPESITSYGGNFALAAAQAQDMVQLGGIQSDMSAVMVDAEGDADADMTIYVNGTPHGTVKVGSRQVIYLAPYNIYRIRLAAAKGGLYNVSGGERKVTLYPGNVARLTWHVDPFNVVTARITTPDGKPLVNAALQESSTNIATDSKGRFQAELTKPTVLHFTPESGPLCSVTLPPDVISVNGVQIYKKPLVCQ